MGYTKAEQQDAREKLRKLFRGRKDKMVYVTLRHVSRSGMYRVIGVFIVRDGRPRDIGPWVAKALDWGYDRDWYGVKVGGAGMDMGFHLVYELSSVLFPDKDRAGYILSKEWV